MRQASIDTYGVDIYPGGPLSAYRTYDQQAELYQQYLDGVGPTAAPPGTSEHNFGTAVDLAPRRRCARSSTRSAAPTDGASSRRRTSGGT